MITITALEEATQHYEWLRPRPRGWSVGHIDIVCTRASNIGTSKSTHNDALLHTRFCLTFSMDGDGVQKKGNHIST